MSPPVLSRVSAGQGFGSLVTYKRSFLNRGLSTAYQVSRSLRFNSADSAYLSRTPSSAGNRKTWTWSGWVKRSTIGPSQVLFSTGIGASDVVILQFSDSAGNAADSINLYAHPTSVTTTRVFRDTSAWIHLVWAFDTTQSTAANRSRLYVNGVEATDLTGTYPTLNADYGVNQVNVPHDIGRYRYTLDRYASALLADIHFIDGQALTPSSFAETNATTGQWVPKAYSGTYGTNGFKLDFSDNSAATAAALGKDTSGNGNNWTPNNLSVTAGAGNDSVVDTPTSYGTDDGLGGSVRGNYCTWNPLDVASGLILANGNLDSTGTSTAWRSCRGTVGVSSGKWYWEVTVGGASQQIGIFRAATTLNADPGLDINAYIYNSLGGKSNNNNYTAYGASYGAGDVVGVALDLDGGSIVFYKNGVSQGTAYTGLSGTFCPLVAQLTTTTNSVNFGQRPFAYTAPSGFKALCDTNLPSPQVAKPNAAFDVLLWNGTGGARSFTGLGFSPDLIWGKQRNGTGNHQLYDSVRGAGSTKDLSSSLTVAEGSATTGASVYGYISSFNSDGFSTLSGTDPSYPDGYWNNNGTTYAAWCWDAGSSNATNTQGSITSTVRANASSGFSIITWSSGSAGTIGHGLGVAPSLFITKDRAGAGDWVVYHRSIGATRYLVLNKTDAQGTNAGAWNNTDPTSTVITLGSWYANSNLSMVGYAFAPVAGYSSFGSYTGNGSTDGPFVFCGFRPRWVLIKASSAVSFGSWRLHDTARDPYNVCGNQLIPNLADAEYGPGASGPVMDILSNGFKLRQDFDGWNGNGSTYVWAAFAESPFQYARAR